MVSKALVELSRGLRELVFPPACALCGAVVPGNDNHFCESCAVTLTTDSHHVCPRCGSSVGQFSDLENGCPRCRDERFHFERSFRLGPYDGLLRDAILRMKRASGEVLAECVGRLWARSAEGRFREAEASLVMPIPLHWWRKWRRGHNQSEALSEAIAGQLKTPHEPRWLRRARHTPHQTGLSAAERRDNLRGAFRVTRGADLKGRSVLLVDDVLTTGATVSEAARALKSAGAAKVVVAVLANR